MQVFKEGHYAEGRVKGTARQASRPAGPWKVIPNTIQPRCQPLPVGPTVEPHQKPRRTGASGAERGGQPRGKGGRQGTDSPVDLGPAPAPGCRSAFPTVSHVPAVSANTADASWGYLLTAISSFSSLGSPFVA